MLKRIMRILAVSYGFGIEVFSHVLEDPELDVDAHALKYYEKIVPLKPIAYELLMLFSSNPGVVLSTKALNERVWSNKGEFVQDSAVRGQIALLRDGISDGLKADYPDKTNSELGGGKNSGIIQWCSGMVGKYNTGSGYRLSTPTEIDRILGIYLASKTKAEPVAKP